MVSRGGHSLVEVVVALMLLGAGLAAVSATSVVSTRRTREAVLRQERHAALTALLDSLVADSDPRSGRRSTPWGAAEWEVTGPGDGPRAIRLYLTRGSRTDNGDTTGSPAPDAGAAQIVLAEARTIWIPAPPPVPGGGS